MDISAEKYKSDVNRLGHLSTLLHPVMSITRRLIEFLTLTDKDRLAAGIYLGGKGRDG